jgi:exosortase
MVRVSSCLHENTHLNAEIPIDHRRFLFYGLWLALSVAISWKLCVALVRFSLANDNASHVVLIPFISAWLIYIEQKQIFRRVSFDYSLAGPLFAISAVTYIWTLRSSASWTTADLLAGYALALVLLWISGFVLFFGRAALKNGRFPLLFLFLTIPLPDAMLKHSTYFLQKGSADLAEMIFDLVGVPILREGFVIHLAHLNIEVAKECSGIRSSIALLILALLVAHFRLKNFGNKTLFVACGLFIMILKNGIRIATLTLLAVYVDPSFLNGRLHQEGGIVFFVLGLLLLLPVLVLLQRKESKKAVVAEPS